MRKPSKLLTFLTFISFTALLVGCQDHLPPCEPVEADVLSELTDSLNVQFEWPKDLRISAFSGPDITPSPACLAVAPTGEVYVGVDKIGSLGKAMGQGQIIRLVDCNQDGIVDSKTVFAELDNPRGIIARGDKVYVLHTTFSEETGAASGMDLVVLEDKNGDGVADGPAQPLIQNISNEKFLRSRGTDHATNGIQMGIDGWIYIAVGDFGFYNAVDRDGTKLTMLGGGIVRVRPDGTEMEEFNHGTRNVYDLAIDPYMNIFTRGNTNDGGGWNVRFSHQIQSGEYGYPVLFKHYTEEILPALVDVGGGSGTGALFLDDERWPTAYNQVPLMADWGRSHLYIHRVTPSRGSFTQKEEKFIHLPQITDLDIDGAGIMYLSAWDGAGYSGDSTIGYTVRVVPDDLTPTPVQDLANAPVRQLLNQLQSAHAVVRQAAQFELLKHKDNATADRLLDLTKDSTLPKAVRVAALFTYAQIQESAGVRELTKLTADPEIREFALRAMTDRLEWIDAVPIEPYLEGLKSTDDRVRMASVIGLGRMERKEAADALLEIIVPASFQSPEEGAEGPHATPNSEIIVPHLAVKAMVRMGAIEETLQAVEKEYNPLAMWSLRYMHDQEVVRRLIVLHQSNPSEEVGEEIVEILARLYHKEAPYDASWWWSTRPDTHGPYYKGVEWDGSPLIRDFLLEKWRQSSGSGKRAFAALNSKYRMGIEAFGETGMKEIKEDVPIADLEKIRNKEGQIGKTSIEDVMLALDQIQGDVEEGRKLFVSQGCQTCHNVDRERVLKGPFMGQIGSIMNRQQIAESILKPNASISQGFSTVQIRTRDEKIYIGFVTEESADELVIRNIAGVASTLNTSEIQERKEMESSMMPAGLANSLSFQQFASLVDFLKEQTQ